MAQYQINADSEVLHQLFSGNSRYEARVRPDARLPQGLPVVPAFSL